MNGHRSRGPLFDTFLRIIGGHDKSICIGRDNFLYGAIQKSSKINFFFELIYDVLTLLREL